MKRIAMHFLLFVILNGFWYLWLIFFNGIVPFSRFDYSYNAHHFIEDPRNSNKRFELTNALAQYDAQWYLKIATHGYPVVTTRESVNDKNTMGGLRYAFFPIYPLLLNLLNNSVGNLLLTAFLFSNVVMVLNFFSLYYVIGKLWGKKTAVRTIFLLFGFPFSIFFRSYFAEGLLLLGLIWFGYFWMRDRLVLAAGTLGLVLVTKGNGILLLPIFWIMSLKKNWNWRSVGICLLGIIPLTIWGVILWIRTGSPIYYLFAQSQWYSPEYRFLAPFVNTVFVFIWPILPFHSFHFSKIDTLIEVLVVLGLMVTYRRMNVKLWAISLSLFLTTFFFKDLMAFSRFQSVSWPLFVYLSTVLKGKMYWIAVVGFWLLFFVTGIYFVNWYWVG